LLNTVILLLATLGASAQLLDLNQKNAIWISHLNQTAGKEDQSMIPHRITLDLENKHITVSNENTGAVLYDLSYTTVYSGKSKSVVLQDGESMFMVRDDTVSYVTFDENTQTLSLILHDNTIKLFGKMQVADAAEEGQQ